MELTRTFDILENAVQNYSFKNDFLAEKKNGKWIGYSPYQYKQFSLWLGIAFLQLGLKPGDKIATISNNRPQWNFVDMAAAQTGLIHVPIYTTITPDEFEYILRHSESKLIFVSDKYLFEKINPIAQKLKIKYIFTFDNVPNAPHWEDLLKIGQENATTKNINLIDKIKNSISKDDVVSILYTSGTTGLSKGVMLTHWNFMYQVNVIPGLINLTPDDLGLSFLPLCHSLERIVNYIYQAMGVSTYYAESLQRLADNMRQVRPTIFATVPRVLERIYDKILAKGQQLEGAKRKIFFWALDLANKFELHKKNPVYKTKLALADSLVFSQWRKAIGSRIRYIISGGAKLDPKLAKIFWAAGMHVLEGYGLTETAPVIAVNNPKKGVRLGSVGKTLGPEQKVTLASDGELLFKGPNLMKGYYKDQKKTKEVIDKNGWFHTGDIAKIDKDGFIFIVDRKKEIFKLSNGKYIAPQAIENKLQQSVFIEQALVVGDHQKMPGVIIVPNFEMLHQWANEHKILFSNNSDLIKKPAVQKLFRDEINKINKNLGPYERIGVFRLITDQWSPATGELSPTLKKRRYILHQKYKDLINEMFQALQ